VGIGDREKGAGFQTAQAHGRRMRGLQTRDQASLLREGLFCGQGRQRRSASSACLELPAASRRKRLPVMPSTKDLSFLRARVPPPAPRPSGRQASPRRASSGLI
jgi:hypothetical protein